MGGDHISGHFYLERKDGLSYHCFSPHWLRFDLLFDKRILPNQRDFLNFIPLEFGINLGIGVKVYQFRELKSVPPTPLAVVI